jgi:hypothetical protein
VKIQKIRALENKEAEFVLPRTQTIENESGSLLKK